MVKKNQCKDCGKLCDKRSDRCQPCSNRKIGKSKPRHPKLCEKCAKVLAKRKYKFCHSCNMKKRWANSNYKKKTKAAIRASFDARWSDPATQKKMIKVLTKFNGISKLEKSITKLAKLFGFEHSVAVGRYLADFLNEDKKIIVEVNGDLWHCNPKFWKADDIHPNKKIKAQEIWDKDSLRKEHLESLGYSVLVLWEDDIIKGKDKFVKEFFESIK